jgi:sugar porter (SP) family MFS transporter
MEQMIQFDKKYIWMISLTAALGGFLFGYDWVVVGGAKPFYEPFFNLTSPSEQGWGTSSALVGCMVGAIACIFLSDQFGRKKLLILSGLLFSISAIGTALAPTFWWFNFYRIVGGIAMGIALNLSPLYIAEISPAHKRGTLVTINQLLIMIGVLLAQIVNWRISLLDIALPDDASFEMIAASWSGTHGWRWMFGVEAIPAFVFFLSMFWVPESPRWLVKADRMEEAKSILDKIGGPLYTKSALAEIQQNLSLEDPINSGIGLWFKSPITKVLAIGIFLSFLQQWSGVNVIIYYAADIFQAAGFNLKQMMLNIVVIGGVMVLSVFITIYTVDRFGRKVLLLIGTSSMAILYLLIGYSFFAEQGGASLVVLVLVNVGVYSFTLAPLLWVVLSEIFPIKIRGAAMSIAALAHWVGNFTLTYFFPVIKENLGWANNFWLYGGICVIGFVVILFVLPETKGKSLEQIELDFARKK